MNQERALAFLRSIATLAVQAQREIEAGLFDTAIETIGDIETDMERLNEFLG